MNFIEQVTYDLISRGWDNLRNLTVVFPMHRASLFMKEELKRRMLLQHLDKPVLAPQFTTLSELTDELCAPYLRPDDEIRSICMLYEIFCEKTHVDVTLDTFYGWGKQLLTDFSNADMSEADPIALFQNSAEAKKLEEIHLSEETLSRLKDLLEGKQERAIEKESLRDKLHTLWRLLGEVYQEFGRRQREQGVAYSGARLKYVVDHFEEIAPKLAGRQFAFVGFNYLLAKERALMLQLKPQSLFYWDHHSGFLTNKDAYKYTAENIALFGQALPLQESTEAPKSLKVISTATSAAQAQYVHRWLSERRDVKGRVGIVIADETMLEPVIYALPSDVSGRVNITKGFPLRNTKVYADIITYLSDNRNGCREGETCADVLRRLSSTIAAAIDSERKPDAKNWQQALIQESYYQAQKVLNRFCALVDDGTLAGLSLVTLRNILRRHLEMVSLPFHGDPVTEIQIIGVLETRLLDFDHLLILNVEEGVLPKTQADNSFIPFYLRKYYHMPTGSESAEVYAYNFFRLLRRTDDATILFCNAIDGNNRKSMSRFLMQILTSPEFKVHRFALTEPSILPVEPLDLTQKIDMRSSSSSEEKALRVSPSAIKTYLTCPMKYYLQHIRGISSTQESGIVMQNNELGTLVHGALHAIYRHVLGDRLPAEVTADMEAALLSDETMKYGLEQGFEELNNEYRSRHETTSDFFLPEEHKAETLVAREHIRNVLLADITTAKTQGLRIVSMEKPYYFTLSVPEVGEVQVGGYIDRLDIVNGHLRILDYKSGRPADQFPRTMAELFAQDTKHGNMLQALIYCLACLDKENSCKVNAEGRPVMPALYYTSKKQFDPTLKLGEAPLLDFTGQQQDEFRQLLADKVREMRTTTEYSKRKSGDRLCDSCPFRVLCGR